MTRFPSVRLVGLLAVLLAPSLWAAPPPRGEAGGHPQNDLTILSAEDAPDPFSPNADEVKDANVLTVTYRVRAKWGLKGDEDDRGRRQRGTFELETTWRILDSEGSGALLRTIVSRRTVEPVVVEGDPEEPVFFEVTHDLTWDGLAETGEVPPDAVYPYEVSGRLLRVGETPAPRNVPAERELAAADPVTGEVLLDVTPPEIARLVPEEGTFTNDPRPRIEADYTDNLAGIDVEAVRLLLDGEDVTDDAEVESDGIFFLPGEDLTEGLHTVRVEVSDRAGNATSRETAFTVDLTPPDLSIDPEDEEIVDTTRPEIRVSYGDTLSGVDLATLRIFLDGMDRTADFEIGATEAMFIIPRDEVLSEGQHEIVVEVADNAGNFRMAVSLFEVRILLPDLNPPSVRILFPFLTDSFGPTPVIEGTDLPVVVFAENGETGVRNVDLQVDGQSVEDDPERPYLFTLPIAQGSVGTTFDLSARALDFAGNEAETSPFPMEVVAAPPQGIIRFEIEGVPTSIRAGDPMPQLTVRAVDAGGTPIPDFSGFVVLASSDWQLFLFFSGFEGGEQVVAVPPLTTGGTQAIAAANAFFPAFFGIETVEVLPSDPAGIRFAEGLLQELDAGQGPTEPFRVEVEDGFGNAVGGIDVEVDVIEDGRVVRTIEGATGSGFRFRLEGIDEESVHLELRARAPGTSIPEAKFERYVVPVRLVVDPTPGVIQAGTPFDITYRVIGPDGSTLPFGEVEVGLLFGLGSFQPSERIPVSQGLIEDVILTRATGASIDISGRNERPSVFRFFLRGSNLGDPILVEREIHVLPGPAVGIRPGIIVEDVFGNRVFGARVRVEFVRASGEIFDTLEVVTGVSGSVSPRTTFRIHNIALRYLEFARVPEGESLDGNFRVDATLLLDRSIELEEAETFLAFLSTERLPRTSAMVGVQAQTFGQDLPTFRLLNVPFNRILRLKIDGPRLGGFETATLRSAPTVTPVDPGFSVTLQRTFVESDGGLVADYLVTTVGGTGRVDLEIGGVVADVGAVPPLVGEEATPFLFLTAVIGPGEIAEEATSNVAAVCEQTSFGERRDVGFFATVRPLFAWGLSEPEIAKGYLTDPSMVERLLVDRGHHELRVIALTHPDIVGGDTFTVTVQSHGSPSGGPVLGQIPVTVRRAGDFLYVSDPFLVIPAGHGEVDSLGADLSADQRLMEGTPGGILNVQGGRGLVRGLPLTAWELLVQGEGETELRPGAFGIVKSPERIALGLTGMEIVSIDLATFSRVRGTALTFDGVPVQFETEPHFAAPEEGFGRIIPFSTLASTGRLGIENGRIAIDAPDLEIGAQEARMSLRLFSSLFFGIADQFSFSREHLLVYTEQEFTDLDDNTFSDIDPFQVIPPLEDQLTNDEFQAFMRDRVAVLFEDMATDADVSAAFRKMRVLPIATRTNDDLPRIVEGQILDGRDPFEVQDGFDGFSSVRGASVSSWDYFFTFYLFDQHVVDSILTDRNGILAREPGPLPPEASLLIGAVDVSVTVPLFDRESLGALLAASGGSPGDEFDENGDKLFDISPGAQGFDLGDGQIFIVKEIGGQLFTQIEQGKQIQAFDESGNPTRTGFDFTEANRRPLEDFELDLLDGSILIQNHIAAKAAHLVGDFVGIVNFRDLRNRVLRKRQLPEPLPTGEIWRQEMGNVSTEIAINVIGGGAISLLGGKAIRLGGRVLRRFNIEKRFGHIARGHMRQGFNPARIAAEEGKDLQEMVSKTLFPDDWGPDDIARAIEDVIQQAGESTSLAVREGNRIVVEASISVPGRTGVDIVRVVVDENTGDIITAYPLTGSRIKFWHSPRDGGPPFEAGDEPALLDSIPFDQLPEARRALYRPKVPEFRE